MDGKRHEWRENIKLANNGMHSAGALWSSGSQVWLVQFVLSSLFGLVRILMGCQRSMKV
jgi:hypothetical protein